MAKTQTELTNGTPRDLESEDRREESGSGVGVSPGSWLNLWWKLVGELQLD